MKNDQCQHCGANLHDAGVFEKNQSDYTEQAWAESVGEAFPKLENPTQFETITACGKCREIIFVAYRNK